jgi:hypothetical protein
MWDRQIATDLGSEKLEKLITKAEANIVTKQVKKIDFE